MTASGRGERDEQLLGAARVSHVYNNFYRVPRLGAISTSQLGPLSDDGGPFGFDISAALEVDHCIQAYDCDAILECGTHVGDTSVYLARTYPTVPFFGCDIVSDAVRITSARLVRHPRASVQMSDSRCFLEEMLGRYQCPFIYLDAHGFNDWPLVEELGLIQHGVIVVDDFDIDHERYAYDAYGGVSNDATLVASATQWQAKMYSNNPDYKGPLPVLQPRRRSGRAYLLPKDTQDLLAGVPLFRPLGARSTTRAS